MYPRPSRSRSIRRAIRAVGFTLLFFATFSDCQAQFGASVQGTTQDSAAGLYQVQKSLWLTETPGFRNLRCQTQAGNFVSLVLERGIMRSVPPRQALRQ